MSNCPGNMPKYYPGNMPKPNITTEIYTKYNKVYFYGVIRKLLDFDGDKYKCSCLPFIFYSKQQLYVSL